MQGARSLETTSVARPFIERKLVLLFQGFQECLNLVGLFAPGFNHSPAWFACGTRIDGTPVKPPDGFVPSLIIKKLKLV
jgi:hypothetical protein